MKRENVIIAAFNDVEEAELLARDLGEAGIHASVHDETRLQRFWFFSKPLACAKVQVEREHVSPARRLLRQPRFRNHLLVDEVRCPMCGSPEIEYSQFTRKFITTTLVELCCLFRVLDKEFYCTRCHCTWPPRVPLREETDRLGWPRHGGHLVRRETI